MKNIKKNIRGVKGRVIPLKPPFFMKNGILGGLTPQKGVILGGLITQKGVILTSNHENNILIKFSDPKSL